MTKIVDNETIWFPGIYAGRQGPYAQLASDISRGDLIELVQKRAEEDGEWAIAKGVVGDNEDKMRRMMAWVSDPKNIVQCYENEVVLNENAPTVDWICRDLANATKWIGDRLGG
jgi:hypothetical protein